MSKIFIYPPVIEQSDVNDVFSRLAWYFNPYLIKVDKIYFTNTCVRVDAASIARYVDPLVQAELPEIKQKIKLLNRTAFEAAIAGIDPDRDILLLWGHKGRGTSAVGYPKGNSAFDTEVGFLPSRSDQNRNGRIVPSLGRDEPVC